MVFSLCCNNLQEIQEVFKYVRRFGLGGAYGRTMRRGKVSFRGASVLMCEWIRRRRILKRW